MALIEITAGRVNVWIECDPPAITIGCRWCGKSFVVRLDDEALAEQDISAYNDHLRGCKR